MLGWLLARRPGERDARDPADGGVGGDAGAVAPEQVLREPPRSRAEVGELLLRFAAGGAFAGDAYEAHVLALAVEGPQSLLQQGLQRQAAGGAGTGTGGAARSVALPAHAVVLTHTHVVFVPLAAGTTLAGAFAVQRALVSAARMADGGGSEAVVLELVLAGAGSWGHRSAATRAFPLSGGAVGLEGVARAPPAAGGAQLTGRAVTPLSAPRTGGPRPAFAAPPVLRLTVAPGEPLGAWEWPSVNNK
jgi:hypothetical protein